MIPEDELDRLEEDDLAEKIPSRYMNLYDSDDFEKFSKHTKDRWE